MSQIKAFMVHGDASENLAVKVEKAVNPWVKENGDKIEGAPVVACDNAFMKALVLITYQEEVKEEKTTKK